MNRLRGYLIIAALTVLTSGCLKEIIVDVPSDTGELVIEAYYFGSQDSAIARISRTIGYFQPSIPSAISNAVVVLEEVESGTRDTLRWQDSIYIRTGGKVRPMGGHHYRFRVLVDKEQVVSEALPLLPAVRIDTLFAAWRPANGFLPAGYRLIGVTQDPPGEIQGYRLRIWRNDTLQNKLREWIYSDDRFIDGRFIIFELPFEVKPADTFYVELWTMPRQVIRYYDQLVRNAFGGSGGFSPPPDNAYSNFTGSRRRVWGYFTPISTSGWGLRIAP